MNLYLKSNDGSLQRTEHFPLASIAMGKYINNIFYVPDEEFANLMGELNISSTIPDPSDPENKRLNNEVVTIYIDSNRIHAYLRPEKYRLKDREDFQKVKEDKAKGIILKNIKDN